MDEIAHRTLLFDFYSPLLTGKQQEIFDLYYQQDLSLGEIAEIQRVSRPAVFDILRRTEEALTSYEEKLSLVKRYLDSSLVLEEMKTELVNIEGKENEKRIDKINSLIEKLEEYW